MIITSPGFYNSKAGKCEVVAVRGNRAIGWHEDGAAFVWWTGGGELVFKHESGDRFYITGPFVEPRKPVEAWAVVFGSGDRKFWNSEELAQENMRQLRILDYDEACRARLVHLREVEDAEIRSSNLQPKHGEG